MKQNNNPNNTPNNYITIDGDSKWPQIHCPICGHNTYKGHDSGGLCKHVLLYCVNDEREGFAFLHVHAKLKDAVKGFREKHIGWINGELDKDVDPETWEKAERGEGPRPSSRDFSAIFKLEPRSTCIIAMTNSWESATCCDYAQVIIAFEFPPSSVEMQDIRKEGKPDAFD